MKKLITFIAILFSLLAQAQAPTLNQYGTRTPKLEPYPTSAKSIDVNSGLSVNSTTAGFVPPRMTTTQKLAISSPVAGTLVYDSTIGGYQLFNGTSWVAVGGSTATVPTLQEVVDEGNTIIDNTISFSDSSTGFSSELNNSHLSISKPDSLQNIQVDSGGISVLQGATNILQAYNNAEEGALYIGTSADSRSITIQPSAITIQDNTGGCSINFSEMSGSGIINFPNVGNDFKNVAYKEDVLSYLSSYQPIDSDLTDIAALSPVDDNILQRKDGAWVGRTPAQVKSDLAITVSDVSGAQAALVSGSNIKTVNSTSLLGSGNISVEPTVSAGTTSQYYRGDKTWQTLDATAVGAAPVSAGTFSGTFSLDKPGGNLFNDLAQSGSLTLSVGGSAIVGGCDCVKITANGSAITVPGAWVNIGNDSVSTTNGNINRICVMKTASEIWYSVKVN